MKTIPVSYLIAGLLLPAVYLAQAQEAAVGRKDRGKGHKDGGMRSFAETWKAADKDQDGFISIAEFVLMPRIQKLPEEKRVRIFERLDKDFNDKLGREELGHHGGGSHDGKRQHMKRLWELDADKDGGISLQEFKAGELFKKLPPGKQDRVFRRLDTDGDGVVTPRDKPRPSKNGGGSKEKRPQAINLKSDTNGDGVLSFEEFRSGPAMMGLSEDIQEERFEMLDRNDDLKISAEDFPSQGHKDME